MKNDPIIKYSPNFNIQRKAAPLEIKEAFADSFELFLAEPYHSSLRNHALKGKFAGFRSINISDDWRALFKETRSGNRIIIIFHLIGTHKQLYE